MLDDLQHFLELQQLDIEINSLRNSAEEFPQKIAELEGIIANAEQKVANLERKRDEIKQERIDLSQGIEEHKLQLEQSQQRLSSIKTNREYDAVHQEIASRNQMMAHAENQLGSIDEEEKQIEESLNESKNELEQLKESHTPEINELKAKLATIDDSIASVVEKRNVIVPKITKPGMRIYDRILQSRKDGRVVSTININQTHCSVCNVILQRQLINEVRRATKIIRCQQCGSILVWQDISDEDAQE